MSVGGTASLRLDTEMTWEKNPKSKQYNKSQKYNKGKPQ